MFTRQTLEEFAARHAYSRLFYGVGSHGPTTTPSIIFFGNHRQDHSTFDLEAQLHKGILETDSFTPRSRPQQHPIAYLYNLQNEEPSPHHTLQSVQLPHRDFTELLTFLHERIYSKEYPHPQFLVVDDAQSLANYTRNTFGGLTEFMRPPEGYQGTPRYAFLLLPPLEAELIMTRHPVRDNLHVLIARQVRALKNRITPP